MVTGRPPKPTRLKVLQGTARADRMNDREPVPPTGEVKPPPWLSRAARVQWRRIAPVLSGMGVLTVADQTAFSLLCDALAEYVDARAMVIEHGSTYESVRVVGERVNHDGEREPILSRLVRQRPEVTIAADAYRRASMMLMQFGLTPSARTRVQAQVEEPGDDPFTKWLNHGRDSG